MKIPSAGEAMSKGIYSIEESATLLQAAQVMLKTGASLLLVNDKGKPTGVLSSGELFNSFCLHVAGHFPNPHKNDENYLNADRFEAVKRRAAEFNEMTVRSIMTPRVKTIRIDQGIDEAVRIMKINDIRRLMVTDKDAKLIGVLTRNRTLCLLMEGLAQE